TRLGAVQRAGLRILQECLKDLRPAAGRSLEVDVLTRDRREDLAPTTRATDQHVQPPLTPDAAQGTERHAHVAVGIPAVSDRDEDDVSLVALNRFEILHAER